MAVAYKSAGAGAATATNAAALQPACPATVDASDVLVAHVCYRDTGSGPSATPAGWTLLVGPHFAGGIARHWVYGKIADGSEDGAAVSFGTQGGTSVRHARIYSFSGYTGGAIGGVAVGFDHATATSATVADTGVSTTVADALAVQLVYVTADQALADFTGESGGDWTEAVAEFRTALGSDGSMQLQVAGMASPATINGGTQAITSATWAVYGFEIRPAPNPGISFKSLAPGVSFGSAGNDLVATCPPVVDVDDILIAHVIYKALTDAPSTPTGWTLLAGPESAGSSATDRHWIFGRLADGSEDGASVSFGTAGGTNLRLARIYGFAGWAAGTITDVVIGFAHGTGTGTTINDTGVTTTGADSLAVQLLYSGDDNQFPTSFSGETGGKWVEVAQADTGVGSDATQQLQVAVMASAGTINGGTLTVVNNAVWGVYGFEILTGDSGSSDATATPATIAVTTSLPAATAAAGSTATPSAIAATVTLPAASASAGSTATPAAIAATAAFPAVSVSAGSTATPATVAATGVLLAPTATGGGTAVPAAIEATATLPPVAALAGATAQPATIPSTVTLPAAAVSAGSTATPAMIATAISILAAAVFAGSTASPATIAALATLPLASTGSGATASPATIALAANALLAGISAGVSVSPAVIALAALLPQAVATGGGAPPATPSAGAYTEPSVNGHQEPEPATFTELAGLVWSEG